MPTQGFLSEEALDRAGEVSHVVNFSVTLLDPLVLR
jgi:hypothetical protein